jgi:O-antigen biosynthesis protein
MSLRWRIMSRSHELTAVPHSDVARLEGAAWRAVGKTPRIRLEWMEGEIPRGDVMFDFTLGTPGTTDAPALYLDTGAGLTEAGRRALPRAVSGRLRALVHVPTSTHAIYLAPREGPGEFSLGPLRAVEVPSLVALAKHAGPALKRVLSQPKRLPLMGRRFWKLLRLRGPAGVLQRLRTLTEERSDSRGYVEWAQRYVQLDDKQRERIRARVARLRGRPIISVVMPVWNPQEVYLRRAIDSVRAQLYPHWELCIADDCSESPAVRAVLEAYRAVDARIKVSFRGSRGHISASSNSALEEATGEFVTFLDHDDELAEQALFAVAEALDEYPETDFIFTDEDKIDSNGRPSDPAFKPGWCPEMLFSQNYVCHLAVYRTARVRELGGLRVGFEGSQDHDLVLRYTQGLPPDRIRHLPAVLYHWRTTADSTASGVGVKPYATDAAVRAVQERMERSGLHARVTPGSRPGTYRVKYALPSPPPLVSIIIPTRDRYTLLRRCLESVRARTSYSATEVLVVDNGTREARALEYLTDLEGQGLIRLMRYPGPFNYSAMNNLAVQQANGSILCFLNNDVEAIGPDWLTEMVTLAVEPNVGAVGAKLYYPHDAIQHAGIAADILGVAEHEFRHSPRESDGYLMRLRIVREVAAVTAACMVLRRDRFLEVGGFNESELRVAFNDVDLCFRLLSAGYRNLWTPYAELFHVESVSRGSDEEPGNRTRAATESEYMQRRWKVLLKAPPYSNPNVTLDMPTPVLAWPPRRPQSWFALDGASEDGRPGLSPAEP